jgi:UDP-N-acetylmuramoyl-L-alanyl-D-glutamate--2,6-diaminopimelate ligase
LKARNVKIGATGSEYEVKYNGEPIKILVPMAGGFNVYNSLAAAGVGLVLGLKGEQVVQGIAAVKAVEGRMERIDEGQEFVAMVDYAHSPDSFEKLFSELRPLVKGRIIAVFGSQGRTGDVGKRAIQGKIAGKYADLVVLTEEDDRGEDGMAILERIAAGALTSGKVRDKDLKLILDRPAAIQYAVEAAHTGDMVVFLGKGHEKTIERRAEGEEPWDEADEVSKAIKARMKREKAGGGL